MDLKIIEKCKLEEKLRTGARAFKKSILLKMIPHGNKSQLKLRTIEFNKT